MIRFNKKGPIPLIIRRTTGQAFIEILLALAIMSASFVSLMSVHMQAARWVGQAASLTVAANLSYSTLEMVRSSSRSLDWSALINSSDWTPVKNLDLPGLRPTSPGMKLFLKADRFDLKSDLYRVGVRVEWKCGQSAKEMEMYTAVRSQ